ncbi:hypothetical protein ACN2XU_18020 [Primorskyibacter sp. 2E107]|uniref:hypothetical protein n=1 Tax=Primorskyibacter sp. 2E107 TaxID=3403458 RepID=UPI003AF788FC
MRHFITVSMISALAVWVEASCAEAQALSGSDLTLSGRITQNGASSNFFDSGMSSFNGSACFGNSCTNSESNGLGNPPLKLKWTTAAIIFEDTSTSSFADRDWRIGAEGAAGSEKFVIVDEGTDWTDDAEVTPFTIEGGAPSAAFWLKDTGRVGFGTSLPQNSLHFVGSDSPGIMLEQAGGLGNQRWEVIGNETSLFVRDSDSDTIPFIIDDRAPDDALVVEDTGDIGVGTGNPTVPFHVVRSDGTAQITVQNSAGSPAGVREMFSMVNNGGSYFTLANTAAMSEWYFVHENNSPNRFLINHSDGGVQMALSRTGDMTILGNLFTAGSCSAGCDRVFDADYPLPSIPEQAAMMREYKHLPNVGPTPENGPFNLTAMTGGMLNELEKAHLYIADLHDESAGLRAELAEERARNAEQDARLARLEALLDAVVRAAD